MKIALASDHAGFLVKEWLKEQLAVGDHQLSDYGTHSEESCDYPDYARLVALAVSRGECQRGILICGTGIGMSIVANKIKGIRAALCWNEESARLSRAHNDSNILCLGARLLSREEMERLTQQWLTTVFAGGRHESRVQKIE